MKEVQVLAAVFAEVEDPRIERTKRHSLRDILIIAVCATICGADGWVEIEEWGLAKEAWLTKLLDLPECASLHMIPLDVFSPCLIQCNWKPVFCIGCKDCARKCRE